MRVFKHGSALRDYLDGLPDTSTGFVPTMGALHNGHASLVSLSKSQCDVTVCSIFINPTQFNSATDLQTYPRTEDADLALLERLNCDAVYIPDVKDVYPNGMQTLEHYDLAPLENMLEGASRPGHFQGVANVVARLLDIVQPNTLFLGQKDYQQVLVIKRLIQLLELDVDVTVGEIVREPNGLAMSSRNARLDAKHRSEAGKIYHALQLVKSSYKKNPWQTACVQAQQLIATIPDSQLDYLTLRDANTLAELNNWTDASEMVCLVAVLVDGVRLLDNVVVG